MDYLFNNSTELVFFGAILLGLVLLALVTRKLRQPPPPPQLEPEQANALEVLRTAMLAGATIRGSIRIETDDDMVITFRLENLEHFQVNSSYLNSTQIKRFL